MLLVDTNVLIDIVQDDPDWAEGSIRQLRAQARLHELAINPVIYAELSLSYTTLEALESAVATLECSCGRFLAPPCIWPAGPTFNTASAAGRRRVCCPTSSSAPTRRWKAGCC